MMREEAGKLTGARVGIPPRNVAFQHPSDRPAYFAFDGNPLASSLLVVFSAIFPPGERFFVRSVRRYRDRIDDPYLVAAVSGFIGQESIHGREHERLNEYFQERGYALDVPERAIELGIGVLERFSPTQQLACTVFAEHFTAHLAERWLTDERFRDGGDPTMLRLWFWHALEELEHKAVSFEVHRAVGGTRAELDRAPAIVVAALLPGIALSWVALLAQRDERFAFRAHARGLAMLFGPGGFMTRVLAGVPEYFARDFHPSARDTKALENLWRERLFGAAGLVGDEFKNRAALSS